MTIAGLASPYRLRATQVNSPYNAYTFYGFCSSRQPQLIQGPFTMLSQDPWAFFPVQHPIYPILEGAAVMTSNLPISYLSEQVLQDMGLTSQSIPFP